MVDIAYWNAMYLGHQCYFIVATPKAFKCSFKWCSIYFLPPMESS